MSIAKASCFFVILAGLTACSLNAAPQTDFDEIARSIESATDAGRLPLFGLGFAARAFTSLVHPAGATDVRFAIFTVPEPQRINGVAFESAVTRTVDSSWRMTVRIRSNRGERALIYTKPINGKPGNFQVIVAAIESEEGVLAQFNLSSSELIRWLRTQEGFRS